jgi:dinuclear metal center YbgI/SA1388 family protein
MDMMLTREALRSYLDQLLLSNGVTDNAINGLQVEGKHDIAKLATAVSASLETLEVAVKQGVDGLIVHHGLFWQRDSYVIQGSKKKKLQLLLDHGISLYAYHLPLDMHQQVGNNWRAALDMGWTDLQPFGYFDRVPIGVKGKFNSCTKAEFKKQLETYYKHPAVCAWGGPEQIQTAALVSGGAHKTIIEAAKEGVDAFITGSFDEPIWYQAKEEKVNFYALGHSATEKVGPRALASHLNETLKLPCHFIDIDNPF